MRCGRNVTVRCPHDFTGRKVVSARRGTVSNVTVAQMFARILRFFPDVGDAATPYDYPTSHGDRCICDLGIS